MTELVALFLAGLALFFYGVGGIRTHLNGLTSRRLRQQLSRWARHPVLAGIWGFVFGAITQSSTAVAFILTGLVSSGLMTTARALPIVAWANLGTAVLVFFVSFNLHLAFLYVLGVTGLALAFNLGPVRIRPVVAALFSVGLLFFGLQMMKNAFAPLPGFAWFTDVVTFLQGSVLATFVLGLLLRLLVQSSSAIAVIAIALAHGGLFTGEQAAMMMYGTGVGVGLSIFLLSANLQGIPRQLSLYQALINSFAGLTLATLFYIEKFTGIPLALGLAERLADSDNLRLAFAFLFLQATAVTAALVFSRSAAGWLQKLSPPTDEQDLSRPRFLSEDALEDPESALDLVEKEQIHLLGHLPAQLATVLAETAATAPVPASVLHRAGIAVGSEVHAFIRELTERDTDHDTSRRVLALERRHALIASLNDTTHAFVETFTTLNRGPAPEGSFTNNLAESLHTLILSALDAARSADPDEVDMLLRMTADRGDLMERLRRNLLSGPQPLDHQQKSHLFYLTSLFERAVWLLRQLATLLKSGSGSPDAISLPSA
ncbi:MAG: Na/Pi symporter [Rariglobus sp.]|nr:Na/Pi symporter [Rariglobus sp.]